MRAVLSGFILLAVCVQLTDAQTTRRAGLPIRSPEIGKDRTVTFRLRAPEANSVVLTGEFLRSGKPLEKGSDGVWAVTIGPIAPEIYSYSYIVDGVRIIDPGNAEVKTGSTASTLGSILVVRSEQPAFYDPQPVPHGEIRTHWYKSKSLHYTRRLTVYTPPGYDQDRRTRYPVLYLLHGANADETAWTKLGRVNLILDNLLAAGKIKPFLVVMPFGYGTPPGSLPGRGGGGFRTVSEEFSLDLLNDVMPLVDGHYRTYADREHRAIAGLSMGGVESLDVGLNHLELFSYVGGFSPAVSPADFDRAFAALKGDPQGSNRRLRLLWIGCGADDGFFASAKSLSQFLDAAGIKHQLRQSEGAHTWMVWRRYLLEFAPLLFRASSERSR